MIRMKYKQVSHNPHFFSLQKNLQLPLGGNGTDGGEQESKTTNFQIARLWTSYHVFFLILVRHRDYP